MQVGKKLIEIKKKKFIFIFIFFFAFFINFIYGSIGVFPLDSFSFFDTGFYVTMGYIPIKDYWAFSGVFIDFIQSFFFLLFGISWKSYLIHSSLFNSLASVLVLYFFLKINLNETIAIFFSLVFALLFYSVSGTPFSYQHSLFFSYCSLVFFLIGIIFKEKKFFFFLPTLLFCGFFSNQTPIGYVFLLILLFLVIYIIIHKNVFFLKPLIFGSLIPTFFLFFFLFLIEFNFENFFYQTILFPLSIAEGRLSNSDFAFLKFSDQLRWGRLFTQFRFIHIQVLILLIIFLFLKKKQITFILAFIISFTYILIYHQILTANQTFIFSIISIIAGYSFSLLQNRVETKFKIIKICIIGSCLFTTLQLHYIFNEKRHFQDLWSKKSSADLSKAVDASLIHKKLSGLKWITIDFKDNPLQEVLLLKDTVDLLQNERQNIMLITNYQFFSAVLNKNLNIPNRWVFDLHTYPTKNHKYFFFYKDFFLNKIKREKIEIIYIVDKKEETMFDSFSQYFDDTCFKKKKLNKITASYFIGKCNG